VSYTVTPVAGSATAATSAIVRFEQPVSCCHAGLATNAEHPLPAASLDVVNQAYSFQPRVVAARVRFVPPTAVTVLNAAGDCGPAA
jgi:hypothetical protein